MDENTSLRKENAWGSKTRGIQYRSWRGEILSNASSEDVLEVYMYLSYCSCGWVTERIMEVLMRININPKRALACHRKSKVYKQADRSMHETLPIENILHFVPGPIALGPPMASTTLGGL